MSKLIFAALAISAAADNAETEAVKKIDALKVEASDATAKAAALEKERDDLKAKITTIEAQAAEDRKARAKTLVEAAQADGRIAPKDEEKANKFREKIEAGDTFAEEILAQLPKTHGDITKPLITAGAGEKQTGGHAFETKAKALVEAKAAPDIDTAFGMLADSDPKAYSDYLATLG